MPYLLVGEVLREVQRAFTGQQLKLEIEDRQLADHCLSLGLQGLLRHRV